MTMSLKPITMALLLAFVPGCFRHGGRFLGAVIGTSIITAAIISAHQPPPPYDAYAPPPRPGYAWQPGYWALDDGEWIWIPGRWIAQYPGYDWEPAHWVQDPSGEWRLLPGRWVRLPPPPPPPDR